jgi:hypothetical protein
LCSGEEFYDEATLTALRNSCFGKEWIDEGMRSALQKRTIVPEIHELHPRFFSEIVNSLCCSEYTSSTFRSLITIVQAYVNTWITKEFSVVCSRGK